MQKSNFTGCHADKHGGAVFSEYCKIHQLVDCNFTNNYLPYGPFESTVKPDHDAGAVLLNFTQTTLVVTRCTFEGNKAGGRGGGLYIGNSQSRQNGHLLDSCTFRNNVAKYDYTDKRVLAGVGGGLYVLPLYYVTFSGCLFETNTAGWHGGALVFAFHDPPERKTFIW